MTSPVPQSKPWVLSPGWACLLVAAVVVVSYSNSLSLPFVFDDVPVIAGGGAVPASSGGLTTAGRPLLALSFALNRAVGGTQVVGYHAVNGCIHLLAALALFGLVRRTLGLLPRSPDPTVIACLVAALWAAHPLQTESVTYTVQRAESLMGFFYLLSLYAFSRHLGGARGLLWPVVAVGSSLLAAATKEVSVSLPVVALLYDRAFVAGTFTEALRRRWRLYLGLALSWVVLGALLVSQGGGRGATAGFGSGVPWTHYLALQGPAILRYLGLCLVPARLVFYYGRDLPVPSGLQALACVGVALLLAATVVACVRAPRLGFLAAGFFLILAPSSSVVPVATEVMAEHRMYLPLAFVIAGGVWVLGQVPALRRGRFGPFIGAVAVLALVAATRARNRVYASSLSLWADTVSHLPEGADGQYNLGCVLLDSGDPAAAEGHLAEAARLRPDFAQAWGNEGLALERLGRAGEARQAYARAVELRPDLVEAQTNLANLLLASGESEGALSHYREALRWQPDRALTHCNLGIALTQSGRMEEALKELEAAARLDPALPEAPFNEGNVLAALGRNGEAARCYEAALRLRPDWAAALNNLAVVKARAAVTP